MIGGITYHASSQIDNLPDEASPSTKALQVVSPGYIYIYHTLYEDACLPGSLP